MLIFACRNHYKELLTGVSIVPWQVDKKEVCYSTIVVVFITVQLSFDSVCPPSIGTGDSFVGE